MGLKLFASGRALGQMVSEGGFVQNGFRRGPGAYGVPAWFWNKWLPDGALGQFVSQKGSGAIGFQKLSGMNGFQKLFLNTCLPKRLGSKRFPKIFRGDLLLKGL